MKLYNEDNPAPNPRRVRIFLAEKGISIPMVHVSMRQGAHKSAEFMVKNSLGQVPVLELDDGTTLSESVALTTIDFATFIGIDTPAALTHLHAWHARVSARPSAAA